MIIILAVIAAGCSKEDLTGALDKAKNAVAEGTEKAKQAVQEKMEATTDQVQKELNLAGSFDLTAGDPLKTKACYVSLIPQGSERPTILQLQSYRDIDSDSPPFVFLQAHVQANSLEDLVGEPLSARLFVQREAQGPILSSDESAPIEFKITSIEDTQVAFALGDAVLRDTSTGEEIPVTGSMTGVLE
jgi:hypothetical protein